MVVGSLAEVVDLVEESLAENERLHSEVEEVEVLRAGKEYCLVYWVAFENAEPVT